MSEDTNDKGMLPVTRERQAMIGDSGDAEVQAARQKDAVKRHEAQLQNNEERHAAQSMSTLLSTKEYVGKVPGEEHKPDKMEARKKGEAGFGPGVATPPVVKLIPRDHEGETIDVVQLTPRLKRRGLPGATPLTEPQKVQAVIDEHEVGDGNGDDFHEGDPDWEAKNEERIRAEREAAEKEQAGKDT